MQTCLETKTMEEKSLQEIIEIKEDFDKLIYGTFLQQNANGALVKAADMSVLKEQDEKEKIMLEEKVKQEKLDNKKVEYSACLEAAEKAGMESYFFDSLDERFTEIEKSTKKSKFIKEYVKESDAVDLLGTTFASGGLGVLGLYGGISLLNLGGILGFIGVPLVLGGGFLCLALPLAPFMIFSEFLGWEEQHTRDRVREANAYEHAKTVKSVKKYLEWDCNKKISKDAEKMLDKIDFMSVLKNAAENYKKDFERNAQIKSMFQCYETICEREGFEFEKLRELVKTVYSYDWKTDGCNCRTDDCGSRTGKCETKKIKICKIKDKFENAFELLKKHKEYEHLADLEGIKENYDDLIKKNPKNPEEMYKKAYQQKITDIQAHVLDDINRSIQRL